MSEVATKTMPIVSVKVTDLRDALQKGMLVEQRTRNGAFLCSRLDVFDGKATVTSQDQECKLIRVSFDASGPDMSVLIPRRLAIKFLQGKDGQVAVSPKNDKVVTLSREGLGKVSLTATGVITDFPIPEMPNDLKWSKLEAKWFLKMLRHTLICVATNELRPVLTAIVLEDGKMATADGFRLAVVRSDKLAFGLGSDLVPKPFDKIDVEGMAEVNKQMLMPHQLARAIIGSFGKEESIEFSVGKFPNRGKDVIFVRGDNTVVMGETIMGQFPAIDQLIPQSFQSQVSFSVPLMAQRLNMMDLWDGSGVLRLQFHKTDKSEDVADLCGKSEDSFEYDMQMPIKLKNGVESKIAFNWKYVLDAIKPFSVCNLDLTSPSSPGKFTGDIKELTIVVMPMSVQ